MKGKAPGEPSFLLSKAQPVVSRRQARSAVLVPWRTGSSRRRRRTATRDTRAITKRRHRRGPAARCSVGASAGERSCCGSRARKTARAGREKRLLHRSRMRKTWLQRVKCRPDSDPVILAASSMKTTTRTTLAWGCCDALLLRRSIKDGNWFGNCLLLADTSTGASYLSAS